MSYAPKTFLDLRAYLKPLTGLPDSALGIVGDEDHDGGYHCGKDRLVPNDYSARTARDKAGLTNGASAFDVGWFARLVELTAFLVAEARAGRLPDTRELIGPAADGRAYRWDHLNGWQAVLRPRGDSHERHLHKSDYRDSEGRDKVGPFRRFFEQNGDDMAIDQIMFEALAWRMDAVIFDLPVIRGGPTMGERNQAYDARKALESKVDGLAAAVANLAVPAPAPVDPAALKAVLLDPEVLAAIATAVNDDHAKRQVS